MKKILLLLLSLFVISCVSSGEYKARLADIENLKSEKENLLEQIKNKDKEIDSLKATLTRNEEESKRKNEEIKALKDQVEEIKRQIKDLELENNKLSQEKAKLINDHDKLINDYKDLKKTLESSKDELTKNVMGLKNVISEKDAKIKELELEIGNKNKRIEALKEEDLQNKENIKAAKTRIAELESEKALLEKRLSQSQQEESKLKEEISQKDLYINDLKGEIRALSTDKAKVMEEKEKIIAEMKKTYDNLVTELSNEIKKGEIEVTQLRDKLTLQLVEKILFESGSAEIKGSGKLVIDRVAEILKKVKGKHIRIEGHTDNKPIGPKISKKFATNWELSSARATTVVRYLIEKGGIDAKYLSAVGYAEFRPVASNDTEEGRAKNRRSEIILTPME